MSRQYLQILLVTARGAILAAARVNLRIYTYRDTYLYLHVYVHRHLYLGTIDISLFLTARGAILAARVSLCLYAYIQSYRVNPCEKDSEAVLGVWFPAPLPTPRALPDHGALWPLAVGVEKDLGGIDV